MAEVRIFAYGSNLCLQRIGERTTSVRIVAVATLSGHRLRFHKRGRDGSGKADAHYTGSAADVVRGVVYTVSQSDKRALDRYEGVGVGYVSREAGVSTVAGASERVWIYRADPRWIDASLKPFTWYREYVLVGARQHGLNPDYIAAIAAIEATADPDAQRDALARAVLSRAAGENA